MYIKRKLNDKLEIFKNLRNNYRFIKKTSHRHSVCVGVGGNVLDVKRRFDRLYTFLKRDKRVGIIKVSSILKNPPFGYLEQEDFLNSVIILKTNMQPLRFLDYLMRVERRFLRKRSFKDAPRTLDLDIIFFDDRDINLPKLQIPHPKWHERESVLIPLAELM